MQVTNMNGTNCLPWSLSHLVDINLLLWIPGWLWRGTAGSITIFFTTAGIFWTGFSSKSRIIRPSGKLNEPRFQNIRHRIEGIIRFLVIAFGLLFAFELTLPLSFDLLYIAR